MTPCGRCCLGYCVDEEEVVGVVCCLDDKIKKVIIVGPTTIGKSLIAIALAKQLGCNNINVNSIQVIAVLIR